MKVGTLFRQPVDIRSLDVRMPVAAQIAPSPIVCKDENDVRFRIGTTGNWFSRMTWVGLGNPQSERQQTQQQDQFLLVTQIHKRLATSRRKQRFYNRLIIIINLSEIFVTDYFQVTLPLPVSMSSKTEACSNSRVYWYP